MTAKMRGFSLVELLIVVAIILIIAAIAIPNLLQSRIRANEASAVSSLRQIKTAEVAYAMAYPSVGYASALKDLGGTVPCTATSTNACLLDNSLALAIASPGKSGYIFAATGVASRNTDFVVGGVPISPKSTGNHDFCSTSDATLRFQVASGNPPVTAAADCQSFPSVVD